MLPYLLTVLTNGRPVYLQRALSAFFAHVDPHPVEAFIMDDGGSTPHLEGLLEEFPGRWTVERSDVSLGMCRAHARCWEAAKQSDLPWVFHLEDDQVIVRPVRLEPMRDVLEAEPQLSQMALVRAPWGAEIEYGGYIPQSPGWYVRRLTGGREWIETTRNWATSPALFRTSLTREWPWPDIQCETAIGFAMRERDPSVTFGLWGWGEPWYAHIGVNKGASAHGY